VVVEVSAIEAKTGKEMQGFGKVYRTLELTKEKGQWKVWRYIPTGDELAEKLVAVKTEEECKTLLETEKELATPELVDALYKQGASFANQGEYEKGLSIYKMALGIAEQLNNKSKIAKTLNGIGSLYKDQDDYTQALQYYQRSLKLSEETDDKLNIAVALGNIGLLFDKQGNYSQALQYLLQSLKLFEELGDKSNTAIGLLNVGSIYNG
jgi:tetratricopeptide (TPR) repeat protein